MWGVGAGGVGREESMCRILLVKHGGGKEKLG